MSASTRPPSPRRSRPPRAARPGADPKDERDPLVVVCAGGGGVGKTTTSAALALALARRGKRTLVVTIDPARRLASAMGVPIGDEVTEVSLPGANGRLFALMPDPRRALRSLVEALFVDEPAAKAHLVQNRLFIGLSDAAAGVHELVAMNLVASAAATGRFDVVVIDTAPSRHAIDFVTYPARLAALLGGRTVGWLAGMAGRGASSGPSRGVLSWGAGRAERLLARVTGPNLVSDTASLFGDLALVRGRFVALTERAADLLLGPRTSYVLVVAPTAAARDDALYLHARLDALGRTPRAIVMNRANVEPSIDLRASPALPEALRDVVALLDAEATARGEAAERRSRELGEALPTLSIVRLPHVEASHPDQVVLSLATSLDAHLAALLPEPGAPAR